MLLAALILDFALGEPPAAVHPVVWMGKLVSILERLAPNVPARAGRPPGRDALAGRAQTRIERDASTEVNTRTPSTARLSLAYGALMPLVGVLTFALPAWHLLRYLRRASPPAYFVLGTLLLKSTFSVRGLFAAAQRVRHALLSGQLEEARAHLRSLVSRDTRSLDEPLIVAAAVESVAENSGDSFVAPVFYYALFGVPGALAYRVINTFDSMVGYRGRYEHLGKASARLDDLANLLPARLAGLLLVAASFLTGKGAGRAWRAMWRFHGATESPNAGWPMSAMAGSLDVQLVKEGHYALGEPNSPLSSEKIGEAVKVTFAAALILTALAACVEVLKRGR